MSEEYVPDYASAVMPVLGWIMSNDWMGRYSSYFGQFFGPLGDMIGGSVEEIVGELPTPFFARAARCVYDDFLTVEFEPDRSNVLDEYLSEVGPELPEADVDFLLAFRRSFVTVYHVVDRTPYKSVVLREMSGVDRPILIEDELLTCGLSPGDKIATRIVTMNGIDHLAGSILVLDQDTLAAVDHMFEIAFKESMREVPKYLRNNPEQKGFVRQRVLREAGPIISGFWVVSVLATFENLVLANEDDPETCFQGMITFDSEWEPIIECLDSHPELERPRAQEYFWIWRMSQEDPKASLKAHIWLSGTEIILEACELSRVEEATESLAKLIGDAVVEVMIGEVDNEIEDFDESVEDGAAPEDEWLKPLPMSDEEERAYRQRVHAFLDHQLGTGLDSPLTELNNRIPRKLATTVKGRKQLTEWLTKMEAQFKSDTSPMGLAEYDLGWIWKELGIESHRQSNLFE
jgi:hypothetical protein